jgi:hypothetical protein
MDCLIDNPIDDRGRRQWKIGPVEICIGGSIADFEIE